MPASRPHRPRIGIACAILPAAWGPWQQPAAVVVRNATVWSQGPLGRMENADLLIEAGMVVAVGADLDAANLPNDLGGDETASSRKHARHHTPNRL